MTVESAFDRLAEAELARHRLDLKYADLQLCKRGDYEIVARHIRKKKYLALCFYGAAALLYQLVPDRSATFGSILWLLFGLRAVEEYIDARRTEEILRHLREERDRLNAEAPAPDPGSAATG